MLWFQSGRYTLIECKSANLRVFWAGGLLPPSIYIGKTCHFMGRFQTYNAGSQFRVVDALPLTGKYRQFMRPILEALYAQAEDPRDWLEKEALDRLLIKDL